MTRVQTIADAFCNAFEVMSRKEQTAFLEKLSGQEQYIEMLEDIRDGKAIDLRKEEPRRSLEAILCKHRK